LASSIPATSANVVRVPPASTRRARDREKAASGPPPPSIEAVRRESHTNAPISSTTGPKPSSRLPIRLEPLSGGLALTVTLPLARSFERVASSANDGTWVWNCVTGCVDPLTRTAFRKAPWIWPVSVEVTSCTLPALTCAKKSGL
jgi:hypothetical protein